MNNQPLTIDVIIPVYNCKNYIDRCMKSILNQKNQNNLRIILVDDGSTDNSGNLVDKYACNYQNVITIHKNNGGLSSARNAGMDLIKSDYFTFIDPDDWIEDKYIEKVIKQLDSNMVDILMVPYIRKYKNNSLENLPLGSKTKFFNNIDTKNLVLRRFFGLTNEQLSRPLSIDNVATAWGKFYKSSVFKKIHFSDKKEIYAEDLFFNIKCLLKAQCCEYFVDTHYIYFKENSSSIVHTYNPQMLVEFKNLYGKLQQLIVINNLDEEFYRALNNRIVLNELSILRNVTLSNKNILFKYKKIKEIMNDPIYKRSLKSFDFRKLPIVYRLFYKSCKYKFTMVIYLILVTGERFKTKIKQ